MKTPRVSVIMASYNHQDYVAETIDSVLEQKDVNFEFLISDDGSNDETPSIISGIKDDRIKYYPRKINTGACNVLNELIDRARGNYISIINSDDIWCSHDKLKIQCEILNNNPEIGAAFTNVKYIDKKGQLISKNTLPSGGIFDDKNRSRGEWLRHFYDYGNCLCHPTVLMRKSLYYTIGKYNNSLRQLPDFLMWIKLIKKADIYITPDELVKFRINHGDSVSSPQLENFARDLNEHMLISNLFFEGVNASFLRSGFGDLMINKSPENNQQLEIEKMLLLINSCKNFKKAHEIVGLIKLFDMLNDSDISKILKEKYSIDDRWFHEKAGKITTLLGNYRKTNKKDFFKSIIKTFSK
jgi:glycosyltransferase involved in cell wall biosynthesis